MTPGKEGPSALGLLIIMPTTEVSRTWRLYREIVGDNSKTR